MPQPELIEETLTYSVIGAFYEVYNTLGFGFLEHLYVKALERELRAGIAHGRRAGIRCTTLDELARGGDHRTPVLEVHLMASDRPPRRARGALMQRLEDHLESHEVLGFDVGDGRQAIDFLARLEMGAVEQLLGDAFTAGERERLLNLVEERKGQLHPRELPVPDAVRRQEAHEGVREHNAKGAGRARRRR